MCGGADLIRLLSSPGGGPSGSRTRTMYTEIMGGADVAGDLSRA